LKKIVKHPQLTRYFSKDVAFENEKEILHAKATRYKPDRIIFDGTRVVLLDFKAPPLVQEHINNLNYCANLFKDLLLAEIKCVLYYFDVEEVEHWSYSDEVNIEV
jgi:ATP-dependent helicase/nuclease subunit A